MIIEERLSVFIDSLDAGITPFLEEIESYAKAKSAEVSVSVRKAGEHPGNRDRNRLFCVVDE